MFEIDKKKFGSFVSELRKEQGYTQKELAERLFVSDKAVSKWETSVSIPDTALLIPLANLLGVTVTELLMCERMENSITMDTNQVEDVVKTALAFSKEESARAYQTKTVWPILYLCSVLIGSIVMLASRQYQVLTEAAITSFVLGLVFGAYFCFLVKEKLPVFYDENRCGLYCDGAFRINVPGVVFNNSNWPYIVKIGRIWSCSAIAFLPLLNFVMNYMNAELWLHIERYVLLVLLLGGLFIPIYIVGRKYE